jgi:molybdate transport system substrate-binding protein
VYLPYKLYFLIFLLVLYSGCQKSPEKNQELVVSAAISLKSSLTEIGEIYEKRTMTRVVFNFGASGYLQKQIEADAPVDLFISAGRREMDQLAEKGLIENRQTIASNRLVLIVPLNSNITDLNDLPRLERIALGNPKTVPAGNYTEQSLTNMGLITQLRPKLVYAENVRQVLDYVVRQEAEAGFVYATDLKIASSVKQVAEVPEHLHDRIEYQIAMVKNGKKHAIDFLNLVRSEEGQQIFLKHGFLRSVE